MTAVAATTARWPGLDLLPAVGLAELVERSALQTRVDRKYAVDGTTAGILYHYSAPDNPANDFLVENTKPRYGVMPDLFDADGMNAAILVVDAVKATNGDVSGEALALCCNVSTSAM